MLTIGITCFSEGNLLMRCWESVLHQSSDQWECVLVLDGGGDILTRKIFDAINHPKIRKYKNSSNLGPYQTRNRAFGETQTAFHYYLDGDDELDPKAVECVLSWMNDFPAADIYYTDFLTGKSGSDYVYLSSPPHVCGQMFAEGKSLYGASIIRKQLWEKLGGYRSEFAWTLGDYDFYMTAWEDGAVFCHIPKPLYIYIRRPGAVSDTFFHQYHEIYHLLIKYHPTIFSNNSDQSSFLGLGYLNSATCMFGKMEMQEAEALATCAYDLGREKEALALLRKIHRDKMWPKLLLQLRRKLSMLIKQMLNKLVTNKI